MQGLQAGRDFLDTQARVERLIHAQLHELRQREERPAVAAAMDAPGRLGIAGATTVGALDVHVRQELHVERDGTRAVAGRAAQRPRVVREVSCLEAGRLRLVGARKGAAQLVVYVGIGRHRGTHVGTDGRGVDELSAHDILGVYCAHMGGQGLPRRGGLERRHERLEHEGRLARARHTRHGNESTSRDVNAEGMHRVQGTRLQVDGPRVEHLGSNHAVTRIHMHIFMQKGSNATLRARGDVFHRALGDDVATARACHRAHLHQVVARGKHMRVVVDHDDGVAISHEVAHHAEEAFNICRVQADRGLVEHVQNARRAVAHGTGQLHALPLAGRERGTGAVEREIPQAKLHKAA